MAESPSFEAIEELVEVTRKHERDGWRCGRSCCQGISDICESDEVELLDVVLVEVLRDSRRSMEVDRETLPNDKSEEDEALESLLEVETETAARTPVGVGALGRGGRLRVEEVLDDAVVESRSRELGRTRGIPIAGTFSSPPRDVTLGLIALTVGG